MRPSDILGPRGERGAVFVLIVAFWMILKVMLLLRIELIERPPGGVGSAITADFIVFHLLGLAPCFAITYIVYLAQRMGRRLPMAVQIGLAVILSAIGVISTAIVSQSVNMLMATAPAHIAWDYVIRHSVVYGWAPYACFTAAILVLLHSQALREREQRAAALEIAAREERLRAMRYQVDPHLLFNALNSISALMLDQRSDAAEGMLLRLASYYRQTLATDPTQDVTLEQEIELEMQYLDIERVRFEQRLRVEVDVPGEARSALVPSFLLQPLLENAVKYGVAGTHDRATTIRLSAAIEAGRLHLVVSDDGRPWAGRRPPSTGTGLRNVRERLHARFGDSFDLTAGSTGDGFVVRLAMPLLLDRATYAASAPSDRVSRRLA